MVEVSSSVSSSHPWTALHISGLLRKSLTITVQRPQWSSHRFARVTRHHHGAPTQLATHTHTHTHTNMHSEEPSGRTPCNHQPTPSASIILPKSTSQPIHPPAKEPTIVGGSPSCSGPRGRGTILIRDAARNMKRLSLGIRTLPPGVRAALRLLVLGKVGSHC